VLENGRRKVLHICTQDLRKLQQQSTSPFDRMFGGSLFDNFFQDSDAKEILSGRIGTGDVVRVNFDKSSGKMTFVKQ